MNYKENPEEIKALITLYVESARKAGEDTQGFAWDQYLEKDKAKQRELCKWAFVTFPGVKIINLGWGFSITNIQTHNG